MDLGTLERRVDAAPATGVPLHVGLAWRRVQLLLTLEPATSILPRGSLGLVSEDGSWMPATGGHLDGRALVVRFNVMQGPGQVPLAAGPWRLATRIDGEPPEPLRVGTLEPAGAAERTYTIGRREYRVRPSIDAAGCISIDVELEAVPEGVAQP